MTKREEAQPLTLAEVEALLKAGREERRLAEQRSGLRGRYR